MEARPAYLSGRGRGRGRGGPAKNDSPGSLRQLNSTPLSPTRNGSSYSRSSNDADYDKVPVATKAPSNVRFYDAAARHQEAAQRHLESNEDEYVSSSEEEELEEEGILNSVLKSFSNTSTEVGPSDLGRTEEYLSNSLKSKATVCLICIETVKRTEAIWSCKGCYTSFHITCIQKWIKDGVYQQTLQSEDDLRGQDLPWNCPKCRYQYKQSDSPTRYYCFCGKERDPEPDPWLVPHSCGQVCVRNLQPLCGHTCLLLCHPGPCPPCPKTVRVSCYCGQKEPQMRRCGTQNWSCGSPCRRPLSCGHHNCQKPCHDGECPPCPEASQQPCQCGADTERRPCADPIWHCTQICGQPLSCGQHSCEKVCHSGGCGQCPRAGKRTCPCGKSEFELPCTEDIPTCVDTCGKLLECGLHECHQRCHYGICGMCRETVRKKCRCRKKEKDIQCCKDYLCDTKCPNIKDCGKHACKRKCCDGDCPTCDQPCNKVLGCRNHKCSSRCHKGPCYPCPLTVSISCSCGTTSITVPCGREKITRPPRCNKKCMRPPDCHHEVRDHHRCHFGYCPPCRQVCYKSREGCAHTCPVICHSAVLTKVQEKVQRSGPWEAQPEARLELCNYPCPPCQVPVSVTCLGKHETCMMPCAVAAVSCCHRPCGRLLPCTNHACQIECHRVDGAHDDLTAGSNCEKCEEPCSKPQPEGCVHSCLLPCHPGLCPPCGQMIRMRCHCQQLVLHVECDQWTHADDTERQRLKSCHGKCPKMLECQHQCKALCHAGTCPNPERCVEKVKVRCKCKRKKRNFLCNEVQAGYGVVECDDHCQIHKDKQKQEHEQKNKADEEAAKKREELEIEEYKRKMEPRRRKPRKQRQEVEEQKFLQKYAKFIVAPLLVVLLSGFVYYLFNTS